MSDEQEHHRLQHRPFEDGDPLHALSSVGTFPPDVYQHPEWYAFGEDWPASAAVVLSVRGKPDAPVRLFRAVPAGITVINPGDWVHVAEVESRKHAMRSDDPVDDWPVITAVCRADQVRSGGSDVIEWGYFGDEPLAAVVLPRKGETT